MSGCLIKMRPVEKIFLVVATLACGPLFTLGSTNRVYFQRPSSLAYNYSMQSAVKWHVPPFPSNESWTPSVLCFEKYQKDAEQVNYRQNTDAHYHSEPGMLPGYVKAILRIPDRERGIKWVQECQMYVSYTVHDVDYLTLESTFGLSIFIDKPFTWIWKAGPFGYLRSEPAVIPRDFCGRICFDDQGPDGEDGSFKSQSRDCFINDYPDCRNEQPIVYPIVNLLIKRGQLISLGNRLALTRDGKTTFHTNPGEIEKMLAHASINDTVLEILNNTLSGVPATVQNVTDLSPIQKSLHLITARYESAVGSVTLLKDKINVLEVEVVTLKIILGVMSVVLGSGVVSGFIVMLCAFCVEKERKYEPRPKGLD